MIATAPNPEQADASPAASLFFPNIIVPDDAPFSTDQRRWLDGYLAGVRAVCTGGSSSASSTTAAPAVPLTVLYGSQTGNCEAMAKDIRKVGRAKGFDPKVAALDEFDRDALGEVSHLMIVTSTFGEGDPPDNAKNFTDWVMSDDAPSLEGVSYAVCGFGDSSYTHFNKCARDIDARLEALGATRIADFVACDVDYEDDYQGWRDAAFASETFTSAAGEGGAGGGVDGGAAGGGVGGVGGDEEDAPPRFDKNNPYPATLLCSVNLNGEGSAKQVNHIEIALPDADPDIAYEAGDALGVWPVNCPDEVGEILDAAGLTGREVVQLKTGPSSLRVALLSKRDIGTVNAKTFETLGVTQPAEEFDGGKAVDVVAAMVAEGSAVEPQTLVDALRPLQPRLYSIASSPNAHPGEVHLTVGAVKYQTLGRARKGVASNFLGERCACGSTVGVYIQKSGHFHLPDDDTTPVIMVGPGTGIAPFRAFLEERNCRQSAGKNWLFFGDQHAACDFLYADELKRYQDAGTLTRLNTAWSRDQAEKVYVQDHIRENGQELFKWLEDGAYFYICGDASRMAPDVDKALHDVVAKWGERSEEDAAAYIQQLISDHRYRRDVY